MVAAVAIVWLTLRPDPAAGPATALTPWRCLACGPSGSADLFQNLLLFVPLGVALGGVGAPPFRVAWIAVVASAAIELTQAILPIGRDAALGDVLANGTGGYLGALVVWQRDRWRASLRWAPLLVLGLFVAQLVATSILSRASLRGPEPWLLREAPIRSGVPRYGAPIDSVTLGGRRIITGSPLSAQGVARGGALVAAFRWEAPTDDALTPILRVDDARGWAIAAVDRRGNQIGISLRTRAGTLRWRTPTYLVAVPSDLATGTPIVVSLALGDGVATTTLETPVSRWAGRRAYGALHGWIFINPFIDAIGPHGNDTLWTMAWLLGWGVLLGLAIRAARAALLS